MSQTPGATAARAEEANEHTRWNFAVMVTESSVFMAGLAWVDPSSVLPLFIGKLTPSTVIVGLVVVLQRLGWLIPPIFMAAVLGHRPRRLPWLRWPVVFGRAPFLGFVAYLWLQGVDSPGTVIWLMLIAFGCISLGNGVVSISWQDIIAKSIPSWLRGRFFGSMQFATAAGAFGAGLGVRWMLGPHGPGYPMAYTYLFTLMGVFLTLSTIGCWMFREPIRPVLETPQSIRDIFASVLPTLRRQRGFRFLVLVAVLSFGMSWATPFYMVYAKQELGVRDQIAGIYIWAATLGNAAGSVWWGYLNDRRGPRAVLRGGCVLVTLAPLIAIALAPLALLAARLSPGIADALPYLFAAVFLLGGSAMGATWMGGMTYLFELASHQDRPRYIALMNILTAPGALAPLLIGYLLNYLPFPTVFLMMASFGAASLLISLRMPSPAPLAAGPEAGADDGGLGRDDAKR